MFQKNAYFRSLNTIYRNDLIRVRQSINQLSGSESGKAGHIHRYPFRKYGKMIRSLFLFQLVRAFGQKKTDSATIRFASIIEIIHTSSLIHDDILDESNFRRGQQSTFAKYGVPVAILLGDVMFVKAIAEASQFRSPLPTVAHEAVIQLCNGALQQTLNRYNLKLPEKKYIEIAEKKTASLFWLCAKYAEHHLLIKKTGILAETARLFGVIFQLIDDYNDIVSTKKQNGKPTNLDIIKGDLTLPYLYTYRQASAAERKIIEKHIFNPKNKNTIQKYLDTYNALDHTRAVIRNYLSRIQNKLSNNHHPGFSSILTLMTKYIYTNIPNL